MLTQFACLLLLGHVLEHLPVTLQGGLKLRILTLEISYVSLGRILFLFAILELILSSFNFLFNISEKQVLIQCMNFSNMT